MQAVSFRAGLSLSQAEIVIVPSPSNSINRLRHLLNTRELRN
jgi:hypothetical protein